MRGELFRDTLLFRMVISFSVARRTPIRRDGHLDFTTNILHRPALSGAKNAQTRCSAPNDPRARYLKGVKFAGEFFRDTLLFHMVISF